MTLDHDVKMVAVSGVGIGLGYAVYRWLPSWVAYVVAATTLIAVVILTWILRRRRR